MGNLEFLIKYLLELKQNRSFIDNCSNCFIKIFSTIDQAQLNLELHEILNVKKLQERLDVLSGTIEIEHRTLNIKETIEVDDLINKAINCIKEFETTRFNLALKIILEVFNNYDFNSFYLSWTSHEILKHWKNELIDLVKDYCTDSKIMIENYEYGENCRVKILHRLEH